LIGEIVIGDDCVIGANAVVHTSVSAGHIAVGVPAVAKKRSQ
jgi:serine O-acetyltransferase